MAPSDNQGWELFDAEFKSDTPIASGSGVDRLRDALPDNECRWGLYRYSDQYLVRFQWKGPGTNAMAKNKSNQGAQKFIDKWGDSAKVTIEILSKSGLTHEAVWERIRPGSGSKVID